MSSHRDRKLELALKHELRAAGTPDGGACVDTETLGAWADGGLDAAQMGSVEVHVATCARCQAIVGATARSAPAPAVNESSAGFSLWKWWLAPIAPGAAAVTVWTAICNKSRPCSSSASTSPTSKPTPRSQDAEK